MAVSTEDRLTEREKCSMAELLGAVYHLLLVPLQGSRLKAQSVEVGVATEMPRSGAKCRQAKS